MKTNCQWCQEEVNASPELIARAKAGDVMVICPTCKSAIEQNRLECEEYERRYSAELARLQKMHAGGG